MGRRTYRPLDTALMPTQGGRSPVATQSEKALLAQSSEHPDTPRCGIGAYRGAMSLRERSLEIHRRLGQEVAHPVGDGLLFAVVEGVYVDRQGVVAVRR